jgi:ketosteroid isomerase-like protein
MSQENVELALRISDAWNRRDAETVIALWDPDGVWYPPLPGIMKGRGYRGYAGVRRYYAHLAQIAEESRAEYPEVRDLGDQVLGLGRTWFRFANGVEVDQESAFLFTWRNGKCVEARAWISHAEALEAVGLRE